MRNFTEKLEKNNPSSMHFMTVSATFECESTPTPVGNDVFVLS